MPSHELLLMPCIMGILKFFCNRLLDCEKISAALSVGFSFVEA